MKRFELKPTYENIKETFKRDILHRNADVLRMANIIHCVGGGTAIALDAKWGAGKTFFVKQLKMVFDAHNAFTNNLQETDKEEIVEKCKKYGILNEVEPTVTVYYDAWANDNDIDPILSLLYTIINDSEEDFQFAKNPNILKIAGNVLELFSGYNVNDLIESLSTENLLDKIKKTKKIQNDIRDILQALKKERGNQLVVIIDELDRCKPSFAVQLLERIKHYFDIEDVIFVFAINISELQHTVKQYYGNDFNASGYLTRFFNLTFELPPADLKEYYRKIGIEGNSYAYDRICLRVISEFKFELRDTERFYALANTFAYKNAYSSYNDTKFAFNEGRALLFSTVVIVPIIIGLIIYNQTDYTDFINGKNSSPLLEVMKADDEAYGICSFLLGRDETYERVNADDTKKVVKLEDKLRKAYEALFAYNYGKHYNPVLIGEASFSNETKEEILKMTSGLSKYANFQ